MLLASHFNCVSIEELKILVAEAAVAGAGVGEVASAEVGGGTGDTLVAVVRDCL